MTKYIQRHSKLSRWVHGIHLACCCILILSGLFVFIPALGEATGPAVVNVIRAGHRVIAVIFIIIPILTMIFANKGFKHMMANYFVKWDKDDKTFLIKFLPYLFAPKKVHMPDQREVKSGQRIADGALIIFSIFIAISGVILWIGTDTISASTVAIALVVHDVCFLGIAIFGMAHGFLGGGIFQPYRGIARVMFGDGKVSESDALYHWGHWAKDELKSGENITEE